MDIVETFANIHFGEQFCLLDCHMTMACGLTQLEPLVVLGVERRIAC